MGLLPLGLGLALATAVLRPASGAEPAADRERQIRAALVYKVARFVAEISGLGRNVYSE